MHEPSFLLVPRFIPAPPARHATSGGTGLPRSGTRRTGSGTRRRDSFPVLPTCTPSHCRRARREIGNAVPRKDFGELAALHHLTNSLIEPLAKLAVGLADGHGEVPAVDRLKLPFHHHVAAIAEQPSRERPPRDTRTPPSRSQGIDRQRLGRAPCGEHQRERRRGTNRARLRLMGYMSPSWGSVGRWSLAPVRAWARPRKNAAAQSCGSFEVSAKLPYLWSAV